MDLHNFVPTYANLPPEKKSATSLLTQSSYHILGLPNDLFLLAESFLSRVQVSFTCHLPIAAFFLFI